MGLIALVGVDAETGGFMLLYLDLAYEQARRAGRLSSLTDLRAAILNGAVQRIPPKIMTVSAMAIGLAPVMWSTGIPGPMIGVFLRPSSWSWSPTWRYTKSSSTSSYARRSPGAGNPQRRSPNKVICDAIQAINSARKSERGMCPAWQPAADFAAFRLAAELDQNPTWW